jgi:hypothetical protein
MKTIHRLGTYLSVNRGIIDQKASQPYSSIHQPMFSKMLLCEKKMLIIADTLKFDHIIRNKRLSINSHWLDDRMGLM